MGKNAKLRQQRKLNAGTAVEKSAYRAKLASSSGGYESAISQYVKELTPEPEKQSFFQKIADRFNPLPKADKYAGMMAEVDFFKENNTALGAIAWEGYQNTNARGLLFVENLANQPIRVKYIPTPKLKSFLGKYGVGADNVEPIQSMVKIYHPEESVAMLYVSHDGDVSIGSHTPDHHHRSAMS